MAHSYFRKLFHLVREPACWVTWFNLHMLSRGWVDSITIAMFVGLGCSSLSPRARALACMLADTHEPWHYHFTTTGRHFMH
jgi:hypothetical protein